MIGCCGLQRSRSGGRGRWSLEAGMKKVHINIPWYCATGTVLCFWTGVPCSFSQNTLLWPTVVKRRKQEEGWENVQVGCEMEGPCAEPLLSSAKKPTWETVSVWLLHLAWSVIPSCARQQKNPDNLYCMYLWQLARLKNRGEGCIVKLQ